MKAIFAIPLLLGACGIVKDGKYVEDNTAEEVVEVILEEYTGVEHIDLSPNSEEEQVMFQFPEK